MKAIIEKSAGPRCRSLSIVVAGNIALSCCIALGDEASLGTNETRQTSTAVKLQTKPDPHPKNDQRTERTVSMVIKNGSLKMVCNYYSSELIGRKVYVPTNATGTINLTFDDLTIDEAKRAISEALRKIGYVFRDDPDGTVTLIRIHSTDQ
ncbi:MAG: hypothetical protein WCI03_08745 [bacterium]